MLGRLLQTAASTFSHGSSRPQTPLESVTEEVHTRDLLFPEVTLLRSTQHHGIPSHSARQFVIARDAVNYDDRGGPGGLDVSTQDIRVIIAQDSTARFHQPQVLYDSQPPRSPTSRNGSPSKENESMHSRRLSIRGKATTSPVAPPSRRYHASQSSSQDFNIPPMSPASPWSSESRFRNTVGDARLRASPFEHTSTDFETAQGKLARETKEDTDALLGCMFGAPGFRLDPGTKLHVIPKKSPESLGANNENKSNLNPRPLSSGGFSRRRTPLVRSTSVADMPNGGPPALEIPGQPRSAASRPAVMFTSLFSVHLLEATPFESDGPNSCLSPDFSTSTASENGEIHGTASTKTVKQKKIPMYAVSVILQIPSDALPPRSRPNLHGASSLSSSYNDPTPANSWKAEQSILSGFMELRTSGFSASDSTINHCISHILTHWSMISRALVLLETTARTRLVALLEQAVPLAPLISPPPGRGGVAKQKKAKQPTQQSVYVHPDCLQNDPIVGKEAEATSQRIVNGLRIRRVVTGQGRWGAWREEARWVGKLAGGREQNFFFFNFLTAFLGSNTAWLGSVGPSFLKRKHALQKLHRGKDGVRLAQRTVIVSTDKMAARRLIFLLAAFLPSTHADALLQLPQALSAAAIYSESPPSFPITRDPSLRRTINSRTGSTRKPAVDASGHARSVSFSLMGTGVDAGQGYFATPDGGARRSSDARSIRGASLAIPSNGESRKTSTSTIIQESAVPVPHFSTISIRTQTSTSPGQRPGSEGSLASQALTHTLMRSESNTTTSGSGGHWGSVVSGFWSNRRDSSTDDSDALASSQEGMGDALSFQDNRPPPQCRLARMVNEAVGIGTASADAAGTSADTARILGKPLSLEDCLKPRTPHEGLSSARTIPQRQKPERMPLKLSLNENEGYIDVEMPPTLSFSSSLASSCTSSRMVDNTAGSFHEHYSPYGMPSTPDSPRGRPEPVVEVAGWLKTYHPDFILQAVRPYDTLHEDIKQSMRAEAQCGALTECDTEALDYTWHDLSTTLIADTASFSVQKVRLRRRRLQPRTQSATNLDTRADFEEAFISEPVMDMDATLIDAVERVLAQSGHSSQIHSVSPSPAHSRAGSIHSGAPLTNHTAQSGHMKLDNSALEIPYGECRKMVLGALQEVVKSVYAEQCEERADGSKRGKEVPDSTLREGVRRWLVGVEDGM